MTSTNVRTCSSIVFHRLSHPSVRVAWEVASESAMLVCSCCHWLRPQAVQSDNLRLLKDVVFKNRDRMVSPSVRRLPVTTVIPLLKMVSRLHSLLQGISTCVITYTYMSADMTPLNPFTFNSILCLWSPRPQ